jgi:hypothetical protein
MTPCRYIKQDGEESIFDLDNVVDIVRGYSHKKEGWTSLIIFDLKTQKFIELRDSPPDIKGNSKDEAEEVSSDYLQSFFGIKENDLIRIKKAPTDWQFIDRKL